GLQTGCCLVAFLRGPPGLLGRTRGAGLRRRAGLVARPRLLPRGAAIATARPRLLPRAGPALVGPLAGRRRLGRPGPALIAPLASGPWLLPGAGAAYVAPLTG